MLLAEQAIQNVHHKFSTRKARNTPPDLDTVTQSACVQELAGDTHYHTRSWVQQAMDVEPKPCGWINAYASRILHTWTHYKLCDADAMQTWPLM